MRKKGSPLGSSRRATPKAVALSLALPCRNVPCIVAGDAPLRGRIGWSGTKSIERSVRRSNVGLAACRHCHCCLVRRLVNKAAKRCYPAAFLGKFPIVSLQRQQARRKSTGSVAAPLTNCALASVMTRLPSALDRRLAHDSWWTWDKRSRPSASSSCRSLMVFMVLVLPDLSLTPRQTLESAGSSTCSRMCDVGHVGKLELAILFSEQPVCLWPWRADADPPHGAGPTLISPRPWPMLCGSLRIGYVRRRIKADGVVVQASGNYHNS
jgi:hypothetical protein